MPTSSDPRWMVRFSAEGGAALEAAAKSAGVPPAGLIRECAERHAVEVARGIRSGEITPRRRSRSAEQVQVEREVRAEAMQDASPPVSVPASGVERAAAFRLMAARRAGR